MTTNTEEWGNIELPGISDEKLFSKDWLKSGRSIEYYSDPKNRFHRAEIARQLCETEDWKQRHKNGVSTEEYRALKSQQNKDRWNNLEWRKWYIENQNKPEIKKKISEKAKEREQNPEFRKKKMEALSLSSKNPLRNKKISEKLSSYYANNPDAKKKVSERTKQAHANRSAEERKAIYDNRSNSVWRENVKKAGRKKAKPMICDGLAFPGVTDAAKYFDVDPGTIGYRRNKFPERYYYISQEEYKKLTGQDI